MEEYQKKMVHEKFKSFSQKNVSCSYVSTVMANTARSNVCRKTSWR